MSTALGCVLSLWDVYAAAGTTNSTEKDGSDKKLSQSLMETLKTMEMKESSSDEDSDEQNVIMFEKTASSAGSKSVFECQSSQLL